MNDAERGMQALRQVCCKRGAVPLEQQSSSDEDIALWADATIERLTLERDELRARLHDLEAYGGIPEVVQENAALRENNRALLGSCKIGLDAMQATIKQEAWELMKTKERDELLEGCKVLHKALKSGPQIISNEEIEQIQAAINKAERQDQ